MQSQTRPGTDATDAASKQASKQANQTRSKTGIACKAELKPNRRQRDKWTGAKNSVMKQARKSQESNMLFGGWQRRTKREPQERKQTGGCLDRAGGAGMSKPMPLQVHSIRRAKFSRRRYEEEDQKKKEEEYIARRPTTSRASRQRAKNGGINCEEKPKRASTRPKSTESRRNSTN
ncbi:hypothetical protein IWX90DRAFT_194834 [Phyllosticta citrichinensis]|uniref:Uncharacterized protein n=1 Tax=Phyllosticta citrichinensis TaxID=1130410 RepID=A0ABR1XXL3_9PEZI